MKLIIKLAITLSLFSFCSIDYNKINNPFIYINNKKFYNNGKEFFPIAINYIITVRIDSNNVLWPSPYSGYNINTYQKLNHEICLNQLNADMELIKELGFNTVRFVGFSNVTTYDSISNISIESKSFSNENSKFFLNNDNDYNNFYNALDTLFKIVDKNGLKSILLFNILKPENNKLHNHYLKIASNFKNNTSIMAYDLFNEPLYFDSLERTKEDVCRFVKNWNDSFKKTSPNHLITIGLVGIREVIEWDPNILDVDFISFHPYEYEPEKVRNEIRWYGKYVKIPWIIGETALSSDDIKVSYKEQLEFANKVIIQTINCGGVGFSWWQYKDAEWAEYQSNYLGVINNKGTTYTKKGNIIHGSIKPVYSAFKNINLSKTDTCACLENYYNYSNFTDFCLKGFLLNENNEPIEGGVILAWSKDWKYSFHTISKNDGSFELYSNTKLYHWKASATEYSLNRGYVDSDNAVYETINNALVYNLKNIIIKKIEQSNLEKNT